MKVRPFFKLLFSGRASAFVLSSISTSGLCRSIFVSAGLQEGIYQRLAQGPATLDELAEILGAETNREGLASWLRLGVKLRELGVDRNGYRLRGRLSKALAKPQNDSVAAMLIELVMLYHEVVVKTPSLLRQNKKLDGWGDYGELIARSSRMMEEFIFSHLDDLIPSSGPFNMLEVGCGSGTYIQYACTRNKELTAVGLELEEDVAAFAENNIKDWQIADRVGIKVMDVLKYKAEEAFDLVTLHNNIYYFPVAYRVNLAAHLLTFLKPGGRLVITSGCQGGSAMVEYLNLVCLMTKAHDALPYPNQLKAQLEEAGFENVICKRLLPKEVESLCMFVAKRPL